MDFFNSILLQISPFLRTRTRSNRAMNTGSMQWSAKNLSPAFIRGEILWWLWNFDRPSSNLAFFPFFLFFSPPLSIFFHGWKACIDHKRARTYTWRNLDGTQHVYKIMRSTVYPGYLRNRHKFIAIALLVEFPGNRIGKHRFPFLIVEGNARSRIKLMAVSHDENSWFFTMKNKFKSAGNCVEFVRAQSSESSFKFFLYLFVYLFIYIYFDPIHTVWWIQFLIFQRRNGHFVLVKRRLTIGQAGSWIPPVSINFRSH